MAGLAPAHHGWDFRLLGAAKGRRAAVHLHHHHRGRLRGRELHPPQVRACFCCTAVLLQHGARRDCCVPSVPRMPAILDGDEAIEKWLDFAEVPTREAMKLIRPAENIAFHPVSTFVNSVRNDTPECLVPIELGAPKVSTWLWHTHPLRLLLCMSLLPALFCVPRRSKLLQAARRCWVG